MNTGIRHPFGDVLYELDAAGNVVVTDGNQQGVFDSAGRWLSGDLREADPHMCGWITNMPPPMPAAADSHLAQGDGKAHPLA